MLEGITVLSQSVTTVNNLIGAIIVSLIITSVIVVSVMVLTITINIDVGYYSLGIGLCIFIVMFKLLYNAEEKSTYTTYKVTISEDVSFKEFTDKYEILSQYGQIYEIREKEIE